jgi:hypothetical protein
MRFPPVPGACRCVQVLDDQLAPIDLRAARDSASREVQVQGPHHVNPGLIFEEPKLCTQARVEIDEFVAAVASVKSYV